MPPPHAGRWDLAELNPPVDSTLSAPEQATFVTAALLDEQLEDAAARGDLPADDLAAAADLVVGVVNQTAQGFTRDFSAIFVFHANPATGLTALYNIYKDAGQPMQVCGAGACRRQRTHAACPTMRKALKAGAALLPLTAARPAGGSRLWLRLRAAGWRRRVPGAQRRLWAGATAVPAQQRHRCVFCAQPRRHGRRRGAGASAHWGQRAGSWRHDRELPGRRPLLCCPSSSPTLPTCPHAARDGFLRKPLHSA